MQHDPATPRRFPRRPLAEVAAALFLGSWLGTAGPVEGPGLALATASALAALAASVLTGAPRLFRAALLALLAGAAALRASDRASGTDPIGRWRPAGAYGEELRGDLGRGARRIALAPGLLEEGDRVAVLPAGLPPLLPRGPEAGPLSQDLGRAAPVIALPDEIARLAPSPADPWRSLAAPIERLRAHLLERAGRIRDPSTRGLVSSLLFGDLSRLPRGVPDLFVRTGTFHVLAISGMQVALVAFLLLGPLASLIAGLARALARGRIRRATEPIRAALLWTFVPLAGAGAPVVRSALAWALAPFAPRIRAREPVRARADARPVWMPRRADPLSLWSLALACECLLHPDAPLSLSVRLSYGATLGLIVGTGPIASALRPGLPGGGRVAPVGATGRPRPPILHVLGQRLLDAGISAVAASLAAVLATLPFAWQRFGEWSPPGILATPAIALPMAWLLAAGWIHVALPGAVPEWLLDAPARAMLALLEVFDRAPGSPAPLPPRPFLLLAAPVVLAFLGLGRALGPRARRTCLRAAALLAGFALLPWAPAPDRLEVVALEVGSGTSVVFRAPGSGTWVFDAGSRDRPDVAREALGPYLRRIEAARIAVVLSHEDRDHDGALPWLVERFPPRLYAGALPPEIAGRLPRECAALDVDVGRAGLPAPRGGELEVQLSRGAGIAGNEGSRCLLLRYRGEEVLLCGDAEEEGLSAWLRANPHPGPVRVLLLPHHGSDTALLGPLLDAARPGEVWISAEGDPPLAGELDRRELAWRCTSRDGPLAIRLPATGAP